MNYPKLKKTLDDLGITVFTPRIASEVLGTSIMPVRNMLERYKKLGIVESPKRGVYLFAEKHLDPFDIAHHLYTPSYLSFETAMSRYSIIPEVVYATISATTKPTREFVFNGVGYLYRTIKKSAYTGYIREGDHFIAEPEKALADYLYFVAIENYTLNDRLDLRNVKKDLALQYCKLFASKPLDNLVKRIL